MSSNQSLEGTQTLWDYLDKTYKQNIVAPAYQLFHNIHNTHLSNNGTITEYLEKITRQAFKLDQLGWKIPDPIIASYMLLGLSDRYDSLISEIQNTPLDEWKSEWVKNRVLTHKINAPADLISKTLQEHGDTQDFTTRVEAAKAIRMAQAAMKRYYDGNHQAKDFETGQEVMLRLHRGYSIPQTEVLGRKLGPQFAGPFMVVEKIGPLAYRLDLPLHWKIHPVISIAHLEPRKPNLSTIRNQHTKARSSSKGTHKTISPTKSRDSWPNDNVRSATHAASQINYLPSPIHHEVRPQLLCQSSTRRASPGG